MKRKSEILVVLLMVLLVFSACRSSKKNVFDGKRAADVQQVLGMQALKPIDRSISAKLKISLGVDGKSFSSGGTFKAQQSKGMQIGVTAMGIFEVARLEFTPDNMLVINKIGKECATVEYTGVDAVARFGLGYDDLESVLLNSLFMPDGRDFASSVGQMEITVDSSLVTVVTPETSPMRYTFVLDKTTGELVKTVGNGDGVHVECNYSDFTALDGRTFPRTIELSVNGGTVAFVLDMKLKNIKQGGFIFKKSDTENYRSVSLSQLLDAI